MRIAVLTRYGMLGASSRLRFYQYFDALARAGLECEPHALFDDEYLRRHYAGRRASAVSLAAAALTRVAMILRGVNADLAWVEYEVLPWCPPALEGLLASRLPPMVLEYDDAVFHRYDQHERELARGLFGDKIGRLIRRARAVIVGNEYLRAYATNAGASIVHDVPTTVDLERFPVRPRPARTSGVVVGWIGSPSTVKYLAHLGPVVSALRARGIRLLVVGGGPSLPADLDAESREWIECREADDLADMDIGIMPLDDGPWERGKSGYKLVQYMAAGLPVVASPVGVNCRIVSAGETGLFASSPEEWLQALERLAGDPDLRFRMGAAGRARCEAQYSLQVQAPVLAAILQAAGGESATRW